MGKGSIKKSHLTPEDVKFLMNVLRRGTIKWPGREECFRRHRRRVIKHYSKKTGLPVYKYEWNCARCMKWYRDKKKLEMDHIVEIGSHNGDWNDYVHRCFSPQSNLQLLCLTCHMKKTTKFNSARTRWKRKSRSD